MESTHYKVTVGNNSEVATKADAMEVADRMVKDYIKVNGTSIVPDIKPCDAQGNLVVASNTNTDPQQTSQTQIKVSPTTVQNNPPSNLGLQQKATDDAKPVYSDWNNTKIDEAAKTRIEGLHNAVAAAGGPKIDTSNQFFATGTRMAREGYSTQRQREQEHFEKPLLTEAITQLQDAVSNEIRRDYMMSSKEIGDSIEVENNKVYIKDHVLTERAIRGLVLRLESPSISYLLGLRERAATNRNVTGEEKGVESDVSMLAEVLRYELLRNPDVAFKLRMREYPQDVYAALSPTYAVADAPHVMKQILEQMPKDARGDWRYDVDNTEWELKASIWTPVPVDQQAVGEPFEGYVSLSSRDNGTGSFNGGGGINLLRCLNASTYSAGEAGLRRTHRGEKVLFDVKTMIAKSLKSISALCQAWGKARKEEIDLPTGLTLEQAMPGFWRALLKEGELVNVLPGRKENHIKALTQTYFGERRDPDKLVRADLAQSWTRYIQDQPTEVRHEAELAIGSWMVTPSRKIRCDMKE